MMPILCCTARGLSIYRLYFAAVGRASRTGDHLTTVARHRQISASHGSTHRSKSITGTDENPKPPPLKSPFPYPHNANPTPHQIFHLPFRSTQEQIKARYYELVRTHHPDSVYTYHLSSDVAHARFRSIKASYDFLRGRTASPHPNSRPAPSPRNFDPYLHELSMRRRAYYASHHGTEGAGMGENSDIFGSERWAKPGWGQGFGAPKHAQGEWKEDGRRERLILTLGVITLLAGLFPTLPFTVASILMPTSPTKSYLPDSPPTSHPNPTPDPDPNPPKSIHRSTQSDFVATAPSSFPFNLIPDMNKSHREAVAALVQARREREEMGAERREGLRRQVREINDAVEARKDDESRS